MRLLFIRHGDPDYEIDNLTDKGKVEAKLLAKHINTLNIDEVFVSPLGRAGATADFSLKELGLSFTVCDWLKEFPAEFDANTADEETKNAYRTELKLNPDSHQYEKRIIWDILPSYYANHPELFDVNEWKNSRIAKYSDSVTKYNKVISSFDSLLSDHGYERTGNIYKVKESNEKTLAFFCHFGITSVLLSRLWNVSPFIPLQFLATAPTSVTEVVTEEREQGIAIFRTLRIGDTTHLSLGNEKPSFSARFCERFENYDQRH